MPRAAGHCLAALLCWALALAPLLAGTPAAAQGYEYRLRDSNRDVFGGPSGLRLYRPPPYTPPIYQPKQPRLAPRWRAAPGLNPLRRPRKDLRPWRPR